MTATPSERFWQSLEAVPCLAAVRAEWDQLLGDEFGSVRPFLRKRPDRATSFPAPDGGLPYEVRDCGGGELVGVCPDTGSTVSLTPSQLEVYELDRRRLAGALAEALGIDRTGSGEDAGATMHLGRFVSAGETRYDCFLTVPNESADVQVVATRLIAEQGAPFILFAPTRRWVRRATESLMRFRGCVFLPLAEVISLPAPGRLAATRPLDRALAQATGVVSVAEPGVPSRNAFRMEGDVWALTFSGRTVRLKDSLGLKCLARLIARKRLPLDAAILKAGATGNVAVKPGDGFAVFDRRGWEECRAGYADLAEQLEEATACSDVARQERLQEQMAVLAGELQSATGLGGRERKKKDQSASARTSVKNAIDRTLAILADRHPELARHIETSVTTGATLVYDPVPDVEWDL